MNKVERILRENEISQTSLAKELGKSQQNVSITIKRGINDCRLLKKIADIISAKRNVTINWWELWDEKKEYDR